jgi:hypothetical protein
MSPFDEVQKELKQRFFGRVFDDVLGYLRLYDFLKYNVRPLANKSKSVTIESFWYSILGDRFCIPSRTPLASLRDGDIIKLKDVFVSEWSPKLPGQAWTSQGVKDLTEGQERVDPLSPLKNERYSVILDPYGKEKTVSAGFGSVRIKPNEQDENYCMYLSATNATYWQCDYGIPLVVSRPVYKEFSKYAEQGAPWVDELEGVLRIHEDLPFRSFIPRAIGAKLDPETEDALKFRPNLKKCYIYISSPLSIKFTYNDSHPIVTAWTMYKTDLQNAPYRFTYGTFDPSYEDSFDEVITFLKDYVSHYDGQRIITDFDGKIPRLNADIPLSSDPLITHRRRAFNLVTGLNKWVKEAIKNIDRNRW